MKLDRSYPQSLTTSSTDGNNMAILITNIKERNIVIDLLAILFGIGAWVAVNGLWVELPILVEILPEQWSLPSYMTIVIQTANIGAILYGILHKYFPNKINETSATVILMIIGILSTLLTVFFWDKTAYISGKEHSIGLLTLVFFMSLVDCTSSLVFIPFMAVFAETYLVTYFVGEGFSGFLPSIVALAQGVGGNPDCVNVSIEVNGSTIYVIQQVTPDPNFSVEVFFYVLFAMMCVSFIAFLCLRLYQWPDQCYASPNLIRNKTSLTVELVTDASSNYTGVTNSYQSVKDGSNQSLDVSDNGLNITSTITSSSNSCDVKVNNPKLSDINFYMIVQTWINFLLNGVLMSIQSYSCLPYGNVAYHYTVTLSNAANPIACFVAFFLPNYNKPMIALMSVLGTLIGMYILVLAALSPVPPLVGTYTGEALVILSWILITGILSHTKTSIAMLLHEKGSQALFWYGSATQLGSFIGSILMFVLVNKLNLFQSYSPC